MRDALARVERVWRADSLNLRGSLLGEVKAEEKGSMTGLQGRILCDGALAFRLVFHMQRLGAGRLCFLALQYRTLASSVFSVWSARVFVVEGYVSEEGVFPPLLRLAVDFVGQTYCSVCSWGFGAHTRLRVRLPGGRASGVSTALCTVGGRLQGQAWLRSQQVFSASGTSFNTS